MHEHKVKFKYEDDRIINADNVVLGEGVLSVIIDGEVTETIFGVDGINCDIKALRNLEPRVSQYPNNLFKATN